MMAIIKRKEHNNKCHLSRARSTTTFHPFSIALTQEFYYHHSTIIKKKQITLSLNFTFSYRIFHVFSHNSIRKSKCLFAIHQKMYTFQTDTLCSSIFIFCETFTNQKDVKAHKFPFSNKFTIYTQHTMIKKKLLTLLTHRLFIFTYASVFAFTYTITRAPPEKPHTFNHFV